MEATARASPLLLAALHCCQRHSRSSVRQALTHTQQTDLERACAVAYSLARCLLALTRRCRILLLPHHPAAWQAYPRAEHFTR